MKILSINFKNINSLAGESRLSFTKAPFANTGVFAITGANGSGKSSILDAITLALYGETARFDQPAANVITQNASDAYAEVEFKLGATDYQSVWTARREPEADHQAVEMRLTRLSDGAVLATTPHAVCNTITDLTGMNFRNFTRSMLLAQNEFTAFLHALDSERMGILETLSGTDIYADFRNEITRAAGQAQQSIEATQQELAALSLQPPETLAAWAEDLQDFQAQVEDFKARQKVLEQQQEALKHTADLQLQVVEQKKRLKELQAQLNVTEQSLANIAIAKQALNFQDDLAALDDKQQALQQQKAAWNALQNELQFLREQLGDNPETPAKASALSFAEQHKTLDDIKFAINQARLDLQTDTALLQTSGSQLAEKKAGMEEAEAWLAENAKDAALVEQFPELAQLRNLRATLAELGEKHKNAAREAKKASADLTDTRHTLEKTKATIVKLKHELAAEEQAREALLQGYPAEKVDDLQQEQQARIKEFEQLLALAQDYHKLGQPGGGVFGLFGGKPQVPDDPDLLAVELLALQDNLKREENIKLALDSALHRETLVKKLLAERVYLVNGKPCPLCGSKEHPYLHTPPSLGNSAQALADQQLKLRNMTVSIDKLNKRIVLAQKNAEKNRAIRAQMDGIKATWVSLSNRLNTAGQDLDIERLADIKQRLQEEQDELKNILSLSKQYRQKTLNIAKITDLIGKNEAAVLVLQDTAEQLEAAQPGALQAQADALAVLSQCQQEEQALAATVLAQLAAVGEAMPSKGKEEALLDQLNSRRQAYQTHLFRRNSLGEDVTALTGQHATCQSRLVDLEEKLADLMGRLQGEEQIGVHLALVEKQQLIAEKERLLNDMEQQSITLQSALQARLQGSPFANFTELRKALQLLGEEPEFIRVKLAQQAQVDAKAQELEQVSAQLDHDFVIAETAPHPDEIYRQLTEVAEKCDIAQLEVQRLQRSLAQQTDRRQRHDELRIKLRQQELAAQPALAELALLENENGMAFRRRVQLRLADKLLARANALLEKISRRYYLRYDPEHEGLALMVEDTFQNNTRRPTKSLSGGESFVISLALALSLSELANNNKSVDSLFIDEGFGNLDGDSLSLVLSALEGLRAQGKTVGVISHVDAVKKRIKAQVQVVKKANGLAVLK